MSAGRRESEASGMLFREMVPQTEEPEPSIEQIEKLAQAKHVWRQEAQYLLAASDGEAT